ncbi:MAG: hypothetical protein N2652_09840 [Kiritimatiellae bacterium]|nr:hypothetical protein [Kiritimatiellia bacterium]
MSGLVRWMPAILGLTAVATFARTNLVFNGSFDAPGEPLKGWRTHYDLPGESWYAENRQLVSVISEDAGRRNVLRLHVKTRDLAINQGVRADSEPIPFDPAVRYRFSAAARSTGPDCRILLEGYRWKPGIRPHERPDFSELRKCYKFVQLYFGPQKAGDMGGVGRAWSTASMEIPGELRSDLQGDIYNTIRFVIVHVVAIGGREGDLFVDDVVLEPLGPVRGGGARR